MRRVVVVLMACIVGCAHVPSEEESAEPEVAAKKDAPKKSPKDEQTPAESKDSKSTPPADVPTTPAPELPPATPAPPTPTPLPPFFVLRVNDACLDVPEGNHADGIALITYKCHAEENQLFHMGPNASLRSSAGKCVDVPGGQTAEGTNVILWPCNGGTNQKIERVGETLRVLGKCLTSKSGSVVLATCNGSVEQYWRVE